MAALFDPQGRAIALGKKLGAGGEGAVYELAGDPRRVAKIYHQPATPEKALKLRAMARLACDELTAFASWPLAVLHGRKTDEVAGILLPRVKDHAEIHTLYSPAQRKLDYPDKDWSFLVHVAMNCAAAFDAIHGKSHVIGDVNQGNLLVSKRGTVFLIDCDSFQVNSSGKLFMCDVGVPQYTPPELQGRTFRGLERTANHDRFGLALIIFHLLFMGRHPFAGRFLGKGDLPIEQAIAEYRYAFSPRARDLQMAPPPQTLPPEQIAPRLAPLFEQAFGRESEAENRRPCAEQWHTALAATLKSLQTCGADRGHKYPSELATCPWCALMLAGAPNFFISVTFRATSPDVLNVTPQLAAVWREIEQVPLPRAAPPPPPRQFQVTPTPPPPEVQSAQSFSAMVGTVALGSLLVSLAVFLWPLVEVATLSIFLVFSLWWLVMFLTTGSRPERHRRKQVLRARRGQLKQLEAARQRAISAAEAQAKLVRHELRAARDQIDKLRPMYEVEVRKLGRTSWQRQLDAYLQTQLIFDATIEGIGPGRKATLASYGVETACDVEYNRVLGVPGMGPYVANNICAWRSGLERQFASMKTLTVDTAERQALLIKFAQVRQQLEAKLRNGPRQLRDLNTNLQASLSGLASTIEAAERDLAQAQADVQAMGARPEE